MARAIASFVFLATCAFAATDPLAGQKPGARNPPRGGPSPGTTSSITVTDAVDLGSWWAEVTTLAIGPGENPSCPNGRLFFGNSYHVLATDLDGNPAPLATNPWSPTYTETHPPHIVYDNQLLKLKNGALLLTTLGGSWNDNVSPKPAWWNSTVEYPAKKKALPGARAVMWTFRSDDCGASWKQVSTIDAATLVVPAPPNGRPVKGFCGWPRLRDDGSTKKAALGGWDAHFAYADPHDGSVYVAMICAYGSAKVNDEQDATILVRSKDSGRSWSVIGSRPGRPGPRTPVFSVPGRVAFAHTMASNVILTTFDPNADSVDITSGSQVTPYPGGEYSPDFKVNTNFLRYHGLAADYESGGGFLTAVNYFDEPHGTLRLFRVPKMGGAATQVGSPIVAESIGGDLFHGTLVPGPTGDNLALLYWVERVASIASEKANPFLPVNEFRVSFQVYRGTKALMAKRGELTVSGGHPYRYKYVESSSGFLGDYMGGASYLAADGMRHFVAAWCENGKLRTNTVSVAASLLGAGDTQNARYVARTRIPKKPRNVVPPNLLEKPHADGPPK
jgi:hypothetical protein